MLNLLGAHTSCDDDKYTPSTAHAQSVHGTRFSDSSTLHDFWIRSSIFLALGSMLVLVPSNFVNSVKMRIPSPHFHLDFGENKDLPYSCCTGLHVRCLIPTFSQARQLHLFIEYSEPYR